MEGESDFKGVLAAMKQKLASEEAKVEKLLNLVEMLNSQSEFLREENSRLKSHNDDLQTLKTVASLSGLFQIQSLRNNQDVQTLLHGLVLRGLQAFTVSDPNSLLEPAGEEISKEISPTVDHRRSRGGGKSD